MDSSDKVKLNPDSKNSSENQKISASEIFDKNRIKNLPVNEVAELIKVCLDLELYEEGYNYMIGLIELRSLVLSEEERNFLMRLAKEKLNIYRKGWKNLVDFDQSENDLMIKPLIDEQMIILEKNIKTFCHDIDRLVDKFLELIPENDISATIFYKKLKADYLRYYAEVANQDEFNVVVDKCQDLYEKTYELCKSLDQPYNALTLSVALNYSVFAYFIVDDTKKAYEIADRAYKAAINKISENKNSEIDVLIKNIEDNLTIWKIELFDAN
jgi:hypothetical protein